MNLDIDAILSAAKPWDFTVTVDGETYATRRPAVAELAALSAAAADPGRLPAVVAGLFEEGGAPAVDRWSLGQLLAFVGGYTEYFAAVNDQGKVTAAVVAEARAAVAAGLASGA